MKTAIGIGIVVFALALLGGCAMKKPGVSEAYLVVLKTPKWRFADTGYVRTGDKVAELEVFEAGQRVLRLQIENLVCVETQGCLSKSEFNSRYLSPDYPDDLLYHLLRGEPIFEGKHLVRGDAGYEQVFGGIVYRVGGKEIYFKDCERGIMIKLRRL
jgi:hypothetical protein